MSSILVLILDTDIECSNWFAGHDGGMEVP